MVWLGLESWSTRPTGQAVSHGLAWVRVMVRNFSVFWGGGVKISNFRFHNFFYFENKILHFFFLARRILRSEAQASQARGSTRLVAPGSTTIAEPANHSALAQH